MVFDLLFSALINLFEGGKSFVLRFFKKNCQISTSCLLSWCLEKELLFAPARFIRTFNVINEVNCVLLRGNECSKILRYIRTFDVISVVCTIQVDCVLLRRKRRIENIALYQNFDVITEVNCVLPRRR